MFRIGDAVIHPSYGVGIVIEIKERRTLGNGKRYYSLELLGEPGTVVMVPVGAEERMGLRLPIAESQLGKVWRVLASDPNELPSDHDQRCELLNNKLCGGDVLKIAEAVRDLAWRKEEKRHLTIRGKRLYERGMALLAGELASVRGDDLQAAEYRISEALDKSLHPATGMH
jgi:RNA polymerase-interacting CarD/CdnL/TRCF family regulator